MGKEKDQGLFNTLRLLGATVAYFPNVGKALGNNNAGILTCQMVYWQGTKSDEQGWICKTGAEIEQFLGISRHELDTVHKIYKTKGIAEVQRRGNPAKNHYKFDWDKVESLVMALSTKNPNEAPKTKFKPVVHRMYDAFAEAHRLFNASKDDLYAGFVPTDRYFKDLKKLYDILESKATIFKEALNKKNNVDEPIIITEDEVIDNWQLFLNRMPEWYKINRFTPTEILSNFEKIAQDIRNGNSVNNGAGNKKANPFVDAAKK